MLVKVRFQSEKKLALIFVKLSKRLNKFNELITKLKISFIPVNTLEITFAFL